MSVVLPQAMARLIDFLGELGPRWGLPVEACRVHGYLYLSARPATNEELCAALNLGSATVENAMVWLMDFRLVERTPGTKWRTQSDPWDLMMCALEERRRREVGPALDILRDCQRLASAERASDPVTYGQIGKLLALAEDLAAIDIQTRQISSKTLRQMVGVGGRAARFVNRTFGRKDAK